MRDNIFTHAPPLPGNPLVASLRLFFWIVFHPTAWQNYVASVDSTLPPDFCLLQLDHTQWRNPAMQRLLAQGFFILPALTSILLTLLLWSGMIPGDAPAPSLGYGVASGLAGALVTATTVSVAAGIAAGVGAYSLLTVAVFVNYSAAQPETDAVSFIIVVSLIMGLIGGLAGSWRARWSGDSMGQLITGAVLGILLTIPVFAAPLILGQEAHGDLVSGRVPDVTASWSIAPLMMVVSLLAFAMIGQRHRCGIGPGLILGGLWGLVFVLASILGYSLSWPVAAAAGKGIAGAVWTCVVFSLLYGLNSWLVGPQAGLVAAALGVSLEYTVYRVFTDTIFMPWLLALGLGSAFLGLTLTWWLPALLYPFTLAWNVFIYYADQRQAGQHPGLLHRNSAFWDEHQRLPLLGLDQHLILTIEHAPNEARAAIDFLAGGRQRWAVKTALIEAYVRQLERCRTVEAIGDAASKLAVYELTGDSGRLLSRFRQHSHDVGSALNQANAYLQRTALAAVEKRLDNTQRELTLSSERHADRFYPIAARWYQIVAAHNRQMVETARQNQEIENPYIVGIPLDARQRIFVGRTDIVARIEHLLLDPHQPPLLLYGQRRVGKTSLLRNFERLLPSTILPFFVDVEPLTVAKDYPDFLAAVARAMARSVKQRNLGLQPPTAAQLTASPITGFNDWLDAIEQALDQSGCTLALLVLDEFEALADVPDKDDFDEQDILRMLRHLIQHRERFKLLLAGSHTPDEFRHWAGYLINIQVVEISYLSRQEARQLIEQPIKEFALRYTPEALCRVMHLTRGHPYLVQLLCHEIVNSKNSQLPARRNLADAVDVETAVTAAFQAGEFFFVDLEHNQVDTDGRAVLQFLARHRNDGPVDEATLVANLPALDNLGDTLTKLIRRDLIESSDSGYRFQVELIRRWFAENG